MDKSGAGTPSIAYKVFTFEKSTEKTPESLSVSIPEVSLSFSVVITLKVQQLFVYIDVKLT